MQFLAILKLKPTTDRAKLLPQMKPEAAKAWELVESGVLRSIQYIEGPRGAVLSLEAKSREEAESHVNALPLVEHGLVDVELLNLTPFTGFALLFDKASA